MRIIIFVFYEGCENVGGQIGIFYFEVFFWLYKSKIYIQFRLGGRGDSDVVDSFSIFFFIGDGCVVEI